MEAQFVRHIEALIFAAPTPIPTEEIRAALEEALQMEVTTDAVIEGIQHLFELYSSDAYSFEPAEIAGGYQFLTKGAYHNTLAVHLKLTTKKRLSQAAMETLALVAYKQPVTKSEMEQLRGVSCDYAIQKLLEKELVYISGRSEGPGKPLLYSTSDKFMDYMGIRSMDDLPKPKDFKDLENMVGESIDLADYAGTPEAESSPTEPTDHQPEDIGRDDETALDQVDDHNSHDTSEPQEDHKENGG